MVSVSWAHAENNFQAPLNNGNDLSPFEVWLSAASCFFCTLSRKPKEGVEAHGNALLSDLSSVYVVLKFECIQDCSIWVQHLKEEESEAVWLGLRAVRSGWLQNHDTYTAVFWHQAKKLQTCSSRNKMQSKEITAAEKLRFGINVRCVRSKWSCR